MSNAQIEIDCPNCKGTGIIYEDTSVMQHPEWEDCPDCEGTGKSLERLPRRPVIDGRGRI